MSRNTGNKSVAPRKSSSPLLTGILVGMVIGVGMAAGLAWYIMKSPSPFVQKEQVVAKPLAESKKAPPPHVATVATPASAVAVAPVASAVATTTGAAPSGVAVSGVAASGGASGVPEVKPRFEFYKVLTDKQEAPVKPAEKKPKAPASPPAQSYFLQAGSFPYEDEADKLKVRLALLGIEATIQSATLSDKGVWYRVRMGPYKSIDEMNYARSLLKQNGMDATPMRAP